VGPDHGTGTKFTRSSAELNDAMFINKKRGKGKGDGGKGEGGDAKEKRGQALLDARGGDRGGKSWHIPTKKNDAPSTPEKRKRSPRKTEGGKIKGRRGEGGGGKKRQIERGKRSE